MIQNDFDVSSVIQNEFDASIATQKDDILDVSAMQNDYNESSLIQKDFDKSSLIQNDWNESSVMENDFNSTSVNQSLDVTKNSLNADLDNRMDTHILDQVYIDRVPYLAFKNFFLLLQIWQKKFLRHL